MSSEPISFLDRPDRPRLAYRFLAGREPTVVFLGGFTSDMNGTKATALAAHCRSRGRAFLRFDYSGHGASEGQFEEGTVGRWAADAVDLIDRVTRGPLVLVGSSMGGWIMCLVARARPGRVRGLVGVAAAPDFTEELAASRFSPEQRERLDAEGRIEVPNPYGDAPTVITRELLEDGRRHRVLAGPLPFDGPVRLLHGMADEQVPWALSARLAGILTSPDVELTLVKSGDHRLSDARGLKLLLRAVDEVCARAGAAEGP